MRCKNIIKTLLDILFPQVCGICGKLSGNSLCKKCEILLKKQSKFEIYENDSLENYFDEHMYFFKYDGIIRKVILNYKFKDKAYLYKTISNFLIKNKVLHNTRLYSLFPSFNFLLIYFITEITLE